MGTTSEKLTYLNTTKGKIKDSINLTGANITTEPFRQYSTKLEDAYVDIINNGTDTLYNNFPKVSGEGTSLTLNNTYQAPMRNNLKGNTSQTGTPTPSSPIPVNVVSGDNTITISNQSGTDSNTYNIDLPVENLFDKNSPNLVNGYLGGNGSITTNNSYRVSDYMYIGNYEKITISGNNENGLVYCFYKEDKTFNGANAINGTSKTITPPTDTAYIRVTVKANNLDNYMVEKGSKANSYTPYGTTPIELCKIGNYQDYFYKDSDKWYLHKEIGKNIYTGASGEVWTYYQGIVFIDDTNIRDLGEVTNVSLLSNLFQAGAGKMYIGHSTHQRLHINLNNFGLTDITNVTQWKTWLSTHNLIVYFIQNLTNTEITDTTLINQLEELYIAKSKENQTNISQINNDLGFIISASALKKGV